jgi:glycosyltransferase involved in cell wall biosynthesis
MSKERICLYSNLSDRSLFERVGFYRDDIEALRMSGADVLATCSLIDIIIFRPKMIVAYFYSKSVIAAVIGRAIGAKVILTGGADQISPILTTGLQLIIRQLLAFLCLIFSHRILVSCTDDFDSFRNLCFSFNSLKRKIERVNHAVTVASVSKNNEINITHKINAFTICWMGAESNVKRKGVDKAIKLISLLTRIGINAHLNIAGTDGPGRSLVEKLVLQHNLSDRVHLLGSISEEEKYRRFVDDDIYLQLSVHEGFGVAAAEALFSGMIVVHSNKGGLKDIIGDHGIIIDFSMIDKEDIASIKEFYSDLIKFRVDQQWLTSEIHKYSIRARYTALFR